MFRADVARESLNSIATSAFEYQITDQNRPKAEVVTSFLTS